MASETTWSCATGPCRRPSGSAEWWWREPERDDMIIDSHCHLHDPAFADLRETLRLSLTHDVWGTVAVGCDAETNMQTLAAAAAAPKAVWACLGFHPDRTRRTDEALARVEEQIAEPPSPSE